MASEKKQTQPPNNSPKKAAPKATAKKAAPKAASKATAKKPSPKAASKATAKVTTFSFRDQKGFNKRDVEALSLQDQQQFFRGCERFLGGEVHSIKQFLEREEEEASGAGDDFYVSRYHVFEDENHRFDMWIWEVDNGAIFEAGTAKQIGVYLVQGSYQALVDEPAAHALAEAMQRAAPSGGSFD